MSVNKVILIGNLGKDPEVKFLPSGNAVCNLTLATSEKWKDKNTGQPQEKTEWHRVVFFGKQAEALGEYCKKGSKLYVEGSLETRKWQDQSGADRYTTEIKGRLFDFLDSKGSNDNQSQGQQQQASPAAQPQVNKVPAPSNFDNFEDDIPF